MRRVFVAGALFAAAAAAGRAAEPSWQAIGPDGGPVVSLVRDPTAPARVWVSTGRIGVLRSEDGGESWTPSNEGLPTGETTTIVRAGGALLVGTIGSGLFRSADGGGSWAPVEAFLNASSVTALAVDPRFDSIVYAGVFSGLYLSRDGGATWSGLPYPGRTSTRIVVDPRSSRVFSGDGPCPYSSSDHGATWNAMACPFWGGPIRDFLPDPVLPNSLLVGLEAASPRHFRFIGGLFRTTDGGATLEKVAGAPDSIETLRYAADGAILAGAPTGLFSSRDGGATWQASESFPSLEVTDILVGPGSELLVGTYRRGLFGSRDAGATWNPRSRGIRGVRVGAIALDPRMSSTIWAGSADADGRMAVSRDGGATWEWKDGFPAGWSVDAIAVDPSSSTHLLSAAATPYDQTPPVGLIWTSRDDGARWLVAPVDTRPLFSFFLGFGFDARDSRRAFAGEWSALYSSADGGASWSVAVPGSHGGLAVDPVEPRRMYTLNFRTGDFGITWRPMGLGLASAVSVGSGSAVYAGVSDGVLRSDDFGATFRRADDGIHGLDIVEIVADPGSAKVFAAPRGITSPEGSPRVLETSDGEGTWRSVDAGLPAADVLALAIDPTSGFAYAGGDGGLYRRIESDAACRPTPSTLCLGGGRFRAQIVWATSSTTGSGQARPLTADAGAFWFFSANNIELVVKVVDGTALNGKFWVFGAALTDVEYDLVVTDTTTGVVWTRHNPGGTLASFADTAAF